MQRGFLPALLILAVLAVALQAAEPKTPPELGDVAWERDFATAEARAKETRKPLLVLFQEVPG